MKYTSLDGMSLAELVKKKVVSPEELINEAFTQIEKVNPSLNSVVRTRRERALEEIKELDYSKPFAGVPIVLKDLSQGIAGEKLSCGAKLMENYVAEHDSHFTRILREAGFIIIGQTNTPEYGFKNITDCKIFGETKNPWNTNYSSGGSSGGSAASVASGIVPIAGASDGGGSIRIPASFTSLVGLKPTRGRTPVGPGVGRKWQGAAVDFVLSKSVRDSASMLDILQIIQPEAAFQVPLFEGGYLNEILKPQNKLKIAYTTKSPVGTQVSDSAIEAVMNMVGWLEREGHYVEEHDVNIDGIALMENYYTMNSGETTAMFHEMEKSLGRPVNIEDVELMTWVIHVAGKEITAAEYSNSLAEWDKAAAEMARFHHRFDLYLTPSTAFTAPKNGSLIQNPEMLEQMRNVEELTKSEQQKLVYDMFIDSLTYTPFTQLSNLTGQPSISVPTYLSMEGLPLGVQFTAPKGREDILLKLANQIEHSSLWIGMKGNPILS